ncbi:MAG TPA: molybdopterin-guanine dinucleotide biosynthesis protein B [Clostridia bacterium]|jgi:molybdopterin-guanine dinucleotide biosynthesis protein B|nr:molybdopterin-guanine dinucleotide biosynthesis protein B [Clostridiaceae bacterium]HOA30356.1 molybdopterin-guanine dinucleotide biosynthesis protein B [Clostridia bacterium]HPZ51517.1 molybdopterin-guanine dinucleotide biosynthesis protein B [Clostridia bacterium]
MKVLTVTGLSGSGKTTVIENLIKELKRRGYSIGSVKEIHYEAFAIDTPGKNTYRHRQAGAEIVTARAHNETDILYPGHLPIYEVLSHYNQDYVLLEGVRDCVAPEIAVCKEDAEPEITPLTFAVSGRFANTGVTEYKGLPVISAVDDIGRLADLVEEKVPSLMHDIEYECCGECGTDCRGFLARLLKGEVVSSDCVLSQREVKLIIDGQDIVMVPFVQRILKNAVVGVVSELNGYKEGKKIVIEIE